MRGGTKECMELVHAAGMIFLSKKICSLSYLQLHSDHFEVLSRKEDSGYSTLQTNAFDKGSDCASEKNKIAGKV